MQAEKKSGMSDYALADKTMIFRQYHTKPANVFHCVFDPLRGKEGSCMIHKVLKASLVDAPSLQLTFNFATAPFRNPSGLHQTS